MKKGLQSITNSPGRHINLGINRKLTLLRCILACLVLSLSVHAADYIPPSEASKKVAEKYAGFVMPSTVEEFLKDRPTYKEFEYEKLHFNEKQMLKKFDCEKIYIHQDKSLVKLLIARDHKIVAFMYIFNSASEAYANSSDVDLVMKSLFPEEKYKYEWGASQGSFFAEREIHNRALIYDAKILAEIENENSKPELEKLLT
jgi:hypothetical protein